MAKNFQDIMAEARKEVPEVSAQQVNELLKNNGKSPVILDVRESDEWRQGHLEGALPLPRGFLEIKVETTVPDKNAPIIAYCAGGVRSLLAAPRASVISASSTSCRVARISWRKNSRSLPTNAFKSILPALCFFPVMVCILGKGFGDVFHHPHTMTFRFSRFC